MIRKPAAAVFTLALSAAAATAQERVPTLDVTLGPASSYVSRGVTMTEHWVVEGDVSLAFPVRPGSFTVGAWAYWEPASDEDGFSSLTGYEPGVGEVDAYAQFAAPAGPAALEVGVMALLFPEIHSWNTLELFAEASLPDVPLSPSLIVRKDVVAVGGAYAELNLGQTIPLDADHGLDLGGQLGASAGQDEDGDVAWYARDGLTHLQLSASIPLQVAGYTLTPAVMLTHGFDDYATVDGDRTRFGGSLMLSRSFPL